MHKHILLILICAALSGCVGESLPVVGAGTWFNFDRRQASAIVDDQTITVKTNLALAKNKAIWKSSHISTLTYNNSLLLVGQTPTQAEKDQIEKIIQPIPGISAIYNQITVGQPVPLPVRCNDTYITSQVKCRIVSNRNVGMNRVKVITENGVVYLMGALTRDEQQTAVNIARRVPGVKKVVTIIEPETKLS